MDQSNKAGATLRTGSRPIRVQHSIGTSASAVTEILRDRKYFFHALEWTWPTEPDINVSEN